ncbi:mandelate racemase/muconate lactonizing enzyme family protein [Lentilactobacillus raoultii]|uniref:Mandelate racemase/muconate lactonizing enzyme family protein n=1 Tax=Lentilactobacillus raoultii TaxID=1987503 RepID=A0ABW3PL90_9LACO|nr:mandelate racemase/muconate lactonizing enzyme family protein [Lentilactobacillus raoultii]
MKITSVDVFQLRWFGLMPAWHPIVVRINTDTGISGFGEAGIAYGVGTDGTIGMITNLAKMIIDADPLQTEKIWQQFYQQTFWAKGGGTIFYAAVSALDTALWDIKGKFFNTPVYQLLGGKLRNQIRAYASQLQFDWNDKVHFLTDPKDYAKAAERAVNQGYSAVKVDPFMVINNHQLRQVKHGLLTSQAMEKYADRLRAIRQTIGPDRELILECHAKLTANSASQFIKKYHELNFYYVEEPCAPMNPDTMTAIKDATGEPLASGERISTRFRFEPFIKDRALSVVQPDIGICGGITEAKKICDMADTNDIDVQFHVCGSPIVTAVALQLEAVIPNALIHEHHEISLKSQVRSSAKYDDQPVNGYFQVPDRPGIGQELSESAMDEAVQTRIE